MKIWGIILLVITLLIAFVIAAYLWAHHEYTVGIDFNFKAIALAISAVAITIAAGMFLWRLWSLRSR